MTIINDRTHMRCPRTAQRGKSYWFSVDALSISRLDWAKHAAKHHLDADASNSTIVRRALEHYQAQLEQLLSARATPQQLDLERLRLVSANRGDTCSLSAHLITALPVRKFSDLRKEHAASKPTIIDSMKADLARWSRTDDTDEGEAE